jgi:hypothetical protein
VRSERPIDAVVSRSESSRDVAGIKEDRRAGGVTKTVLAITGRPKLLLPPLAAAYTRLATSQSNFV